jgi:N-acyl homoserine lactone hydrolase
MTGRPIAALVLAVTVAAVAGIGAAAPGIDKLYVLDCGQNIGKDQSRWSPGVNQGKSIEFSDNCYLIRHDKGIVLWDTGIPDAVAAMPDGMVVANGAITYRRTKTLAAQLEQIGLKPADVTYVAVSHTHGDHVGNIALFPSATVLIQATEYDWAMAGPAKPAFASTQIIKKLTGDHDVFGDASIKIISTPGHTPGHQSLLVNLPKTGALLLTGDAVHFQDNWTHRRVPSMNFNRKQTLASLERIAALLEERKAQLWINHDKPQSDRLKYAPAFYE